VINLAGLADFIDENENSVEIEVQACFQFSFECPKTVKFSESTSQTTSHFSSPNPIHQVEATEIRGQGRPPFEEVSLRTTIKPVQSSQQDRILHAKP
jgi:hypothetical protein